MRTKKQRLEDLTKLEEILKGANKRLKFANLKASASGMSRTFNIYCVKDNELIDITRLVASVTDNTFTKNWTMRIQGCGMDMLFETCYQINCQARYLKGLKYDHDFAYNGLVETRYDLI